MGKINDIYISMGYIIPDADMEEKIINMIEQRDRIFEAMVNNEAEKMCRDIDKILDIYGYKNVMGAIIPKKSFKEREAENNEI